MALVKQAVFPEESLPKLLSYVTEVGETSSWSVTSAKHGSGVAQLRDNDPRTFWQSDGVQPHTIEVWFPRLTHVTAIAVLLNFAADESYTPRKLIVRTGICASDISELTSFEMDSPKGWVVIPTVAEESPNEQSTLVTSIAQGTGVYAMMCQICITENHQSGRDTHVRGVKVFGPKSPTHHTIALESGMTLR